MEPSRDPGSSVDPASSSAPTSSGAPEVVRLVHTPGQFQLPEMLHEAHEVLSIHEFPPELVGVRALLLA